MLDVRCNEKAEKQHYRKLITRSVALTAFALTALAFPLSGCEDPSQHSDWHNNMICNEGPISSQLTGEICNMSAGEYAGFKIGMSKEEAFRSYCGGEAGKYLNNLMLLDGHYDMIFIENGRVCDSAAVISKSDIWSAYRTNNFVGGSVTVLFNAGMIFHISYGYSPLAV